MSTVRPPQPGPNYYWNESLKTWLPNIGEILDQAGRAATGAALTTTLASVATSGAAQIAVQKTAAQKLSEHILKYKVQYAVAGAGLVALITYLMMSRKKK